MSFNLSKLSSNPILWGSLHLPGVLAVEFDGRAHIFRYRRVDGETVVDKVEFHPFMLVQSEGLLSGFSPPCKVTKLKGRGELRYLVEVADWPTLLSLKDHLVKTTNLTPSKPQAPYLFINDPVHQYLLMSGLTSFQGMAFSDLRRLVIDIETYCHPGYDFPNPQRPEDRIVLIGVKDNHGFEEIIGSHGEDEAWIIFRLNQIIKERDPDVIEGHNIFRFDLEYLSARARLLGLSLPWGRQGGEARKHRSRLSIAERTIDYPKWEVWGRHVVDTWILAQYYDVATRELESTTLKDVARHFGLAREGRVYLEPPELARCAAADLPRLAEYNRDDLAETLALGELLGYSFFIQSQIFPYPLQNVVLRGNATKIDALLLREYLRQRHAVPLPAEPEPFEGGYSDIFFVGVAREVLNCDVQSLYPSLMLSARIAPPGDELGVFLSLLEELTRLRLAAKAEMQQAEDRSCREYFNALQSTFKVLINSFYGYLGAPGQHFSHSASAAEVAKCGRETIKRMLEWLRERGFRPLEVDTDGIYFQLPPGVREEELELEVLMEQLSAALPPGVRVELSGRYQAMFSYKVKNYALLDYSGRLIIKGSGLRSRGLEPYLRDFLRQMLYLLLTGERARIPELYRRYLEDSAAHRLPIEALAKTEMLAESLESYRRKVASGKRNPAAVYELALQAERPYTAGDQLSYYVCGEGKRVVAYQQCKLVSQWDAARPDENVAYYQEKLRQLYAKFRRFCEDD